MAHVIFFCKYLHVGNSSCCCNQNTSVVNRPDEHRVIGSWRQIPGESKTSMASKSQAVESMPCTLIFLQHQPSFRACPRRKRLTDNEGSIQSDIITQHDPALLM